MNPRWVASRCDAGMGSLSWTPRPDARVGAVRAAGQALSRLAESELGLLNDYVLTRVATAQLTVDQAKVLRFADMILPTLERLTPTSGAATSLR